jgi:Bacterial capsule synthesis protein PGA_cap
LGWDLPYAKRTGNAGAFRHLIKSADLALANFENPAPDKPKLHASGTTFSADPKYLDGLAAAGLDYISLANNHVFDQTWSEPTMEGITLELAFRGTALVQVHIPPHIILDKAQPNFLDPAGAGKFVMGQVFTASKGLLPW